MHYAVKIFKPLAVEGIGFRRLSPDLVNCAVGCKDRAGVLGDTEAETAMLACAGRLPDLVAVRVGGR